MTPTKPAEREQPTVRDLEFRVVRKPSAASAPADAALDLLAEAIADQMIAEARAEVAHEHGVAEDAIDREHARVADAARDSLPADLRESGGAPPFHSLGRDR